MWIGLFSDIHANREALEACLGHARDKGITRFIFLGDYVGYGADPGFVVDTVRREVEKGATALLGNHDDAIASGTRHERGCGLLARLPLTFDDNDRLFVHASAHDPAGWEYIMSAEDASASFAATRAQATFCGHVHVPQLYRLQPSGQLSGIIPAPSIEIPLRVKERWIAVIGSVGQPRDGNPAACYGALETERNVLVYVRVPYDVETAARKIQQAGLPPVLGLRLLEGM
jgi:diadenosine tetraphosphatase ApaH/serine/threonine PP2A family protein phosphatase